MQLIRELLARPLPDIPITFRASGVSRRRSRRRPARWSTRGSRRCRPRCTAPGTPPAARDGPITEAGRHWRAERNAEVVYFHGFDNVYHWGLMDLTLLMAHGDRYVLPDANVCNEFYELEDEKFSTSRNHLIRGGELFAEVPRDLVRFYLALTAPEQRRTNFTVEGLHEVTRRGWSSRGTRLPTGWRLVDRADAANLPTTATGRRRAKEMLRTARPLLRADRLQHDPGRADHRHPAGPAACADSSAPPGDLLLAARTLLVGAAPILIDLAEQATSAASDWLRHAAAGRDAARPLPRLSGPAGRLAVRARPAARSRGNSLRSDRRNAMKLLAIEPRQYMHYYHSRYQRPRRTATTSTCSTASAPRFLARRPLPPGRHKTSTTSSPRPSAGTPRSASTA